MTHLNEKTLPAGEYIVGDPCYFVHEELWEEFTKEFFKVQNGGKYISFKFKGRLVFVAGTEHGDGVYEDDAGRNYPVDSGLIGAIPADMFKQNQSQLDDFHHLISFERDFDVGFDDEEESTIFFGGINIKTDPETEEDEEDGWPFEDEEEDDE